MIVYILFLFMTFMAQHVLLNSINSKASVLSLGYNKQRLSYVIFAGLLLVIIIAFRDLSVGTDTERYFAHFYHDDAPDWREGNIPGLELGFTYLEYWCNSLNLGWIGFSIITSLLIVAPMCYFFYEYSDDMWGSFLIYMTIGPFGMNMSGLRQSLATAMVIVAIIALFKKKYLFFILFVFLGYLFHYSALIALILGFVPLLKYKSKFQLTFLLFLPVISRVAGMLFFNILNTFMPERYEDYSMETYSMSFILELMWFCILLFSYITLIKEKEISKTDFRMFLLVSLFVSSLELSFHVYMASRLSEYFQIAALVAVPSFLKKYRDPSTRMMLTFSVYGLCLLAFIVQSFGKDTLSMFNYKFIWDSIF